MSRQNRSGCRSGCLFTLLIAVLIIALCIAAVLFLRHGSRSWLNGTSRSTRSHFEPTTFRWGEFAQREWEPPETGLPNRTDDVREKQAENADTVGWLYIPDTAIDTPVLHTPAVSNMDNRYLNYNFAGEKDPYGACFADFRAVFGEGTRNELAPLTTLYAHSFREDPAHASLFSALKHYRDEAFARAHPYIYFSTWKQNMAFEVIAVFEAHVNLPYNHCDQSVEDFEAMLEAVRRSSLYDYGAEISQTDRLLVLSTCAMTVQGYEDLDPYDTDYRFVVMGRLVEPGGATKNEAVFSANPNPAPPDDFLHMGYN